jgi:PadR family transcriptional regulator PadR
MGMQDNLKKGTAEMVILSLLSQEDMYGYALTQKLASISEKLFTLREGSLYPVLYRMIKKGYVTDYQKQVGKRVRKYYHIEESGLVYLDHILKEYSAVHTGIRRILTATGWDSSLDIK